MPWLGSEALLMGLVVVTGNKTQVFNTAWQYRPVWQPLDIFPVDRNTEFLWWR